jgi:hypothetical protein
VVLGQRRGGVARAGEGQRSGARAAAGLGAPCGSCQRQEVAPAELQWWCAVAACDGRDEQREKRRGAPGADVQISKIPGSLM